MVRLGWHQQEILMRLAMRPGQTSGKLLQGLNRSNKPEKRLQEHGLIEDRSENGDCRDWFLTDDGWDELRRRGLDKGLGEE